MVSVKLADTFVLCRTLSITPESACANQSDGTFLIDSVQVVSRAGRIAERYTLSPELSSLASNPGPAINSHCGVSPAGQVCVCVCRLSGGY